VKATLIAMFIQDHGEGVNSQRGGGRNGCEAKREKGKRMADTKGMFQLSQQGRRGVYEAP